MSWCEVPTIALVRAVSPSIVDCALTFQDREPIDLALAVRQHEEYVDRLRALGATIVWLPPSPELPDAVFVEDTAVVVDEVAVMTAPKLDSRRREVASTAEVLSKYRPLRYLEGEASLEGGDVMQIGRDVYMGLSTRTNAAGVIQLSDHLGPHGYTVRGVPFEGCLHLKSACTYIGDGTVLANRRWVDTSQFGDVDIVEVAAAEENAGNAIALAGAVLMPSNFPETAAALVERGFRVITVDVSELQKAEAAVTCCNILLASDG